MKAVITNQHGQMETVYDLKDADILDPDLYAKRFSIEIGYSLQRVDDYPFGADYTVTLQDDPGSCICWNSANYLIDFDN